MTLGKLWQSLFAENLQQWAAGTGWSNWSCFSGCWVEVPAFLTLPGLIPQPGQGVSAPCWKGKGIYLYLQPHTRMAVLVKTQAGPWWKRLCWILLYPWNARAGWRFPAWPGARGSSCWRSVSVVCAAIAMATGPGCTQQPSHNKPQLVWHCRAQSTARVVLQGQLGAPRPTAPAWRDAPAPHHLPGPSAAALCLSRAVEPRIEHNTPVVAARG